MNHRHLLLAVLPVAFLCIAASGQNAAASFDGNGTGWIEVPDSPTLVPATGITAEAWVYRINSGSHRAVVRKNSSFLNESYNLRMTGSAPEWVLKTQANGTVQLATGTQIPANSWHHIAGTFDNAIARVYLDGVQIGQSAALTGPLLVTGGTLKIGDGDSEPWSGMIDAVRIWSVARTQQQIQATMNYQINVATGLISSWNLDNNYLDSTGANHGTAMGPVPFVAGAPLIGNLQAPPTASIGSALVYLINNQVPAVPYVFDVSVTGSSPGVTVAPGVVIPLNPPWLNWDTGGALANIFGSFFGFLDAAGHASPYVAVPGDPSLVGVVVTATYVTLNASPISLQFIASPTQTTLIGLAPVISSIAPPVGIVTGGTAITITGNHFQPGASVRIGGAAATGVSVLGATQIACTTPSGTAGPASVKVTNPDSSTVTVSNLFMYVPPLSMTQVSPLVAQPGASIGVTGAGFQQGATLLVGGVAVTPTSLTSTQINFTNPSGVACNASVQVTNPDGQMASKPFNPSPSVLFALPTSGPATGGTSVTLVGTNLFPGTTVSVNGAPAVVVSLNATQMVVTMPPGSTGPATITVTSAAGCSGTTSYSYL